MRPESTRTTHCILLTTIVKHMRHNRVRTATHNHRPFPIIDKELKNFFFLFTFVSAGACFIAAAAMAIVSFDAAAVELVTVELNCGCGNTREDTCRSHQMLKRHLHPAKSAAKPSSTPAVQKLQPLSNKGNMSFNPEMFTIFPASQLTGASTKTESKGLARNGPSLP